MVNIGLRNHCFPWTALPFYFPSINSAAQYNTSHDPTLIMNKMTLALYAHLKGTNHYVWLMDPEDTHSVELGSEIMWFKENSSLISSWEYRGVGVITDMYMFQMIR